MKTKIKIVIQAITSSRDVNGNCYHAASVIRTDTGERIFACQGGASNAQGYARDAGFEWDEILHSESVIGSRQFWRLVKGVDSWGDPHIKTFLRKASEAMVEGWEKFYCQCGETKYEKQPQCRMCRQNAA